MKQETDDLASASILLNSIANKCDSVPEVTLALAKLAGLLFQFFNQKVPAISGEMGFEGRTLFFKFSDSPETLDKLQKMIGNSVIVKGRKEKGLVE